MNQGDGSIVGETAVSLMQGACPADGRVGCSLRKAAASFAAGRSGSKDSLTRCEVDAFLLLAPGHPIILLVHETGEVRRGWVDVPFPEHGIVWVVTDLGERKLLDIALHTVWRSDVPQSCGSPEQRLATSSQVRVLMNREWLA